MYTIPISLAICQCWVHPQILVMASHSYSKWFHPFKKLTGEEKSAVLGLEETTGSYHLLHWHHFAQSWLFGASPLFPNWKQHV